MNIYDVHGKSIYQKLVFSNSQEKFSAEDLPVGIYFYEIVNNLGIQIVNGKLIKH